MSACTHENAAFMRGGTDLKDIDRWCRICGAYYVASDNRWYEANQKAAGTVESKYSEGDEDYVYLLSYGRQHPAEEGILVGVFSTYALAETYAKEHNLDRWEIAPLEVDGHLKMGGKDERIWPIHASARGMTTRQR